MPSRPTSASTLSSSLRLLLFAGPAGRLLAWRTVDGALEAQIAKAAIAALGNGDDLARHQQLKQHLAGFGVGDDGADRHFERDVVACRAEHVGTHAVLAALGIVPARKAVVDQGVQVGIGHRKNVAAAATVAAIGAAKLLVLLMPERDATRPAVSRGDVNVGFVNELHAFRSAV